MFSKRLLHNICSAFRRRLSGKVLSLAPFPHAPNLQQTIFKFFSKKYGNAP